MRSHEYELVSNSPKVGESLGRVWWDGKSIRASSWQLLVHLQDLAIHTKSGSLRQEDGPAFLDALPLHFKNGYLIARKA